MNTTQELHKRDAYDIPTIHVAHLHLQTSLRILLATPRFSSQPPRAISLVLSRVFFVLGTGPGPRQPHCSPGLLVK